MIFPRASHNKIVLVMVCKVSAQKQRRNGALDSPFNLFALATALKGLSSS